jgi:outer membrane receptor for ferrienterochelin and colicin
MSGRFYYLNAFVRLNSSPDTLGDIPNGQIIDAREGVNFVADVNDPDSFQKSNFFSGQLALTQIINSKIIFSASYQGLKTKRENEDDILGVGFQSFYNSIFDGQIHTLNTKLDYIPVSNNRLSFGYEYEWEKFGNDGFNLDGSDQFSTSATQKSNTFFVQNLLGLMNDKLQLAGGIRFQNFSLETPQFSSTDPLRPRLIDPDSPPNSYTFDGATSYYFDKTDTKLRFHIGNGYRVPSLYERFGSFFFLGSFTVIGNPDLEPELSIGVDGGIEQGLYKDKVRLSATYFYTKIKDEIAYLPTDDFGGAAYFNADRVFSRGFETSAEIKPLNKTNIFVSYTYVNSDERNSRRLTLFPPANLSSIDSKRFGVPDHQFTFVATQRIGKNLTVNFDFLATSNYIAPIFSNSTFSTFTYRFDGNRRGDMTGKYTIPAFKERVKFVVFGTIENLFNNEYFENGFRTAGINGRFGFGLNF